MRFSVKMTLMTVGPLCLFEPGLAVEVFSLDNTSVEVTKHREAVL